MTDKTMIVKPVAAAVGVAFVSSLAVSSIAVADENPFAVQDLDSGYLLAGDKHKDKHKDKDKEGSCGEGSCGGDKDKDKEGSCGEGSCGGDKDKDKEGSCGEGSCGGDKDKDKEGSCGEGSCGGNH